MERCQANKAIIHTFLEPLHCRIAKGWLEFQFDSKIGWAFGEVTIDGTAWTIVVWEDEEDPNFFKSAGIEVLKPAWEKLQNEEQ